MSIGPVSKHICNAVRLEAQQHGPIVWLDLDAHYSALAQALKAAHSAGEFKYPVVPFQGSFLETMLELAPYGGDLHRAGLIIHMPGFNATTIKKSPLLEQYAAGRRYRIALERAVREAATGLVAPKSIEAFVASEYTLASADAWLAEQESTGNSQLGDWLKQVPVTAVLQALRDTDHPKNKGLINPENGTLVYGWCEKKLGLDQAWREFAAHFHGSATDSSYIELVIVSHAMAVEFVDDLGRDPVLAQLKPLQHLPKPLVQANCSVTTWLREKHPSTYARIADELEERIVGSEDQGAPEDLGRVDTFRFEEERLMVSALDALEQEEWGKALSWAEDRTTNASFWSSQKPERKNAWRLIAAAATLGSKLEQGNRLLSTQWIGQGDALRAYQGATEFGAWEVDQAHRKLESERVRRWDAHLPHYTTLQQRLSGIRQTYREWANELARKYAKVCKEQGFLPDSKQQQRTLFGQVVRPLLDDHPKQRTAYFLVDALRFELGCELFERIKDTRGVQATLSARFAEAPTLTCIGMNALAGVTDSAGRLTVTTNSKGAPTGLHTGAYAVNNPDSRRRNMKDRAGLKNCLGISLAGVLDETPDTLKRRVSQTRLTVVHSLEIDAAGEHGHGLHVFERFIEQITSAFRLLREAGIEHFVITSDHGFLLLDESTIDRQGFGSRRAPKRRYALHPTPDKRPNQARFSPLQLGLQGLEDQVVFLTDTHVFDRGAQKDTFVHGGISLQERVIPVITMTQKRKSGATTLTYVVRAQTDKVGHGISRLSGMMEIASTGMLAFGGESTLEVALQVSGRTDIEVQLLDVEGAEALGDNFVAKARQPFKLFVRLVGPTAGKVQLTLYHPGSRTRLKALTLPEWFPINVQGQPAAKAQAPAPDQDWLASIESPEERAVFAHITEHGVITEQEATKMLGSPRKFRRFANKLDELVRRAPYEVTVESTGSGKRIQRRGNA